VDLRTARPADYDQLARVVDDWWGRPVQQGLPRLFLDHFWRTSLIAEEQGELRGFLIGLLSPSEADTAYVHFAAVAPEERRAGLATVLYDRFFELARVSGRMSVRAITSPQNVQSIAFHRRLGFEVSAPIPDYNGPGTAVVTMEHAL
jgi:ribosomal protein S18 acetylase RimI-like enzyme